MADRLDGPAFEIVDDDSQERSLIQGLATHHAGTLSAVHFAATTETAFESLSTHHHGAPHKESGYNAKGPWMRRSATVIARPKGAKSVPKPAGRLEVRELAEDYAVKVASGREGFEGLGLRSNPLVGGKPLNNKERGLNGCSYTGVPETAPK
jgi:hypothetical protein